MPDYKRLIAYFYEYIDGKRQRNAGFLKAERRSGEWKIQIQVRAASWPEEGLAVYGYRREGTFYRALPLGKAYGQKGVLLARLRLPAGEERSPQADLESLSGMWIPCGPKRSFVSHWLEGEIRPEELRLPEEPGEEKPESEGEAEGETEAGRLPEEKGEAKAEGLPEEPMREEKGEAEAVGLPEEPMREEEGEAEAESLPEPPMREEEGKAEAEGLLEPPMREEEGEAEAEGLPEERMREEKGETEAEGLLEEPMREEEGEAEAEGLPEEPMREEEGETEAKGLLETPMREEKGETEAGRLLETLMREEKGETEAGRLLEEPMMEEEGKAEAGRLPETPMREASPEREENAVSEERIGEAVAEPKEEAAEPKKMEQLPEEPGPDRREEEKEQLSGQEARQEEAGREAVPGRALKEEKTAEAFSLGRTRDRDWTALLRTHRAFYPFGTEGYQGVMICPRDILWLKQRGWPVGRNSFLMQGFGQYRHLLLARGQGGRYLLGVPGKPMQQASARAFGFPQFYGDAREEQEFGYWCRWL